MTIIIVVILLVNNGVVFANAHFSRDVKEEFVDFTSDNIEVESSIMIADDSLILYFGYYSDIETVSIGDVIYDSEVSDYINSSFDNGTAVYIVEYWFRESFIEKGTIKYAQTYEARLENHRENIARFNSMYVYQTAYTHGWSNIFQITELNQTR